MAALNRNGHEVWFGKIAQKRNKDTNMFHSRYTNVAAVVLAAISMLAAPATSLGEDEQALIDVLQSDAPQADKAITCKKLAIWGSAEAVPSLAALLPDPELTSWARIALEAIPDSAADEALRNALENIEGRPLVGVINSIGVRRDPGAVEALIGRLNDPDVGVASAAAAALGRIGNAEATAALRLALADSPDAVRSAVAEGCILCAERQLAAGSADEATALYDEIRAADVLKQRVVEATRGAILARGSQGVPLLLEQLASSDAAMVNVALVTARELSGPGVSKQLMTALGDVAEVQQARLVLAMADRQDAEAVPAVLESAQDGRTGVRIAALAVLQSMGDASCVPVLLGIATEDDEQVAEAAMATLQTLSGEGIDEDLVARLDAAEGAERLALIELVGRRRIDAVPPLLKAVDDADAAVRTAALVALGEVAGLDNVSVLIERTLNPAYAEEGPIALKALQAACVRMPDREACAEKLTSALTEAPADAKAAILETLTAMGGVNALQTMQAAANSDDAQLQDTATRLLGSWMSVDAGPVLIELATESDGPYTVRALRGYIRLVRQFVMPDQQRAAMCRQAWEASERDAERRLVLQVIERYPSVDMLRVAVEAAKTPTFKDDATAVATSMTQKLGDQADVKQLLEQLQQ
jgi:HEAT repeat protein